MKPTTIVLALSLAVNAALGWAYLGQRDKAVATGVREGQGTATALECSNGTEDLERQAGRRKTDAAPKIEAARKQAEEHNRRADEILIKPTSVPDDACASTQALVNEWWSRRAKP